MLTFSVSKQLKSLPILIAMVYALTNRSALSLDDISNMIHTGQKMEWEWPVLEKAMKTAADSVLGSNGQMLQNFMSSLNLTASCRLSLFNTYTALQNSEGWAIRMLDATAKPPSGILDGNLMDLGSFDACLQLRANDNDQLELFRGQYCLVGYRSPFSALLTKTSKIEAYTEKYGKPPDWVKKPSRGLKGSALWLGTCVPSTCSGEDVNYITNAIAQLIGFTAEVVDCQTDEKRKWYDREVAAVTVLAIIATLSVIGTLADVISRRFHENVETESEMHEERCVLSFCKIFSICHNTKTLLEEKPGSLSALHGIRFFSATWIILCHTYAYGSRWNVLKYRNMADFTKKFGSYEHLPAAVFENFGIPVGSFFFLSGFLFMYTNWNKLEQKNGSFSPMKLLFRKFWRFTPAHVMIIVMLLAMSLVISGPLGNTTLDPEVEKCRESWWKNLIFIHNLLDWKEKLCVGHTWYLSAVMQLHVVGVLLLLIGHKRPIVGSAIGLVLLFLCCVVTGLMMVWHEFQMPTVSIVNDPLRLLKYIKIIYERPFAHFASYYIGMVFGFLTLKYHQVKISGIHLTAGWVAAVLCALLSVYGIYGPAHHVVIPALYVSLHNIGWSLSLGWMTFACAAGKGGYLNRFLSWGALHPLSDLSYMVYMIHPLVIYYREATLRETVFLGYSELVFSFFSNVVASYVLAYICYITVELPFSSIGNVTRKKAKIS